MLATRSCRSCRPAPGCHSKSTGIDCAGIVLLQASSDVVVSFKKAKDREKSHGSGSVTDISGKPMADAARFPRDDAFSSWQP